MAVVTNQSLNSQHPPRARQQPNASLPAFAGPEEAAYEFIAGRPTLLPANVYLAPSFPDLSFSV